MAEFAAIIGVSQGTLSNIESGRHIPSAETLASICRTTEVNALWLLTGEGEMLLAEAQSPATCPLQPGQRLPPKEVCDLMQKTLDVLTSGYSTTIEALEKNVNEFHDTIRLRRLAGEKPDKPHPLGEPEARTSAGQAEPEKKAM